MIMNTNNTKKSDLKSKNLKSFKNTLILLVLIAVGWFLRGFILGGEPGGPPPGPGTGMAEAPKVIVEQVKQGSAEPPKEYIGHVEPIQSVDLKAQVDGYIEQVHFTEGTMVEQDQLLFTIRKDRYSAQVALNEAALAQAKANLKRAEKFFNRLMNADERSVVQANIDSAESDLLQCKAQVQQAKANLDLSLINLGYTEIRAPITGRIGKAMVTKGNYVSPGTGNLAHIVQVNPIRVIFSLTDREYLDFLQKSLNHQNTGIQTKLRLPNGTIYPGTGLRDFEDNQMNLQTGTVAVYERFDNSSGLLVPESYVTIVMEFTDSEVVPIVPKEAVMTDVKGNFVYVVDEQATVQERRIELGAEMISTQCVQKGLAVGENIIVQGIQKVMPGQKVNIEPAQKQKGA
jgi:RND family efflux transporter MFP subunit